MSILLFLPAGILLVLGFQRYFLEGAFFNIAMIIKWNSFQQSAISVPFSGFISLEASISVEGSELLVYSDSSILTQMISNSIFLFLGFDKVFVLIFSCCKNVFCFSNITRCPGVTWDVMNKIFPIIYILLWS